MTETNFDLFKGLPVEKKKADYKWKDEKAQMLRIFRNSKTLKEKNGWSRNVGAGFIAADVLSIDLLADKTLVFEFEWGRQPLKVDELNLRETEEAIKFLEGNE